MPGWCRGGTAVAGLHRSLVLPPAEGCKLSAQAAGLAPVFMQRGEDLQHAWLLKAAAVC